MIAVAGGHVLSEIVGKPMVESLNEGMAPVPKRGSVLQFSTMVPPVHFGGAERVVGWLAAELEVAGLRVHNAGLTDRRRAHGADGAHPINNIYWPFDGVRRGAVRRTTWHAVDAFVLSARRVVESLIDDIRPSVVITHNLRGWGFAPWVVAGELGIPLVHIVHDYGLICNSSTLWRGGVCEDLCRSCALRREATRRRWPGGQIVGVSRAVLTEHERHGLDIVKGAVVVHPTLAAATVQDAVPRRERPDGMPATLGYLGRVNDAKGLQLLLTTMRTTSQRLLVAGDGEKSHVESLQRYSGGNIEWLGWVDTTTFFDQVDVLVVPSVWKEPFGLVVVEAAGAGVPVLLADRPGLVEAARACRARYTTFTANDEAALRTALGRSTAEYCTQDSLEKTAELVDLIVRVASGGRDCH
jgi:glycosyltransferase involved in cell wall biosynthesis